MVEPTFCVRRLPPLLPLSAPSLRPSVSTMSSTLVCAMPAPNVSTNNHKTDRGALVRKSQHTQRPEFECSCDVSFGSNPQLLSRAKKATKVYFLGRYARLIPAFHCIAFDALTVYTSYRATLKACPSHLTTAAFLSLACFLHDLDLGNLTPITPPLAVDLPHVSLSSFTSPSHSGRRPTGGAGANPQV